MGIMSMMLVLFFFGGGLALLFLSSRIGMPEPVALGEKPISSVSAFVSNKSDGISMEEARELQERVLDSMESDDLSDQLNAAARLMTAGLYSECIDAYRNIGDNFPEEYGICNSQIGAALYFMGAYEDAISYYQIAKSHGADPDMMDDNIAEAVEALQSIDIADDDQLDHMEDDEGDDDE